MKKLYILVVVIAIGLVTFDASARKNNNKNNRHGRYYGNRRGTIGVQQGYRLGEWAFAARAAIERSGHGGMYSNIGGTGSTAILRNGRPLRSWTSYEPSEVYYKYDVDGDGILGDTEKAAMRKEMQQGTPPWSLKQYDVDNDGALSDAEMHAIPHYRLDS
jgi:hypothetical protein